MKITNTEYFGIQRKIVANMTSESWQNIPHVTYTEELDFEKLDRYLKLYNTENEKISINTLVLKIITEGLKSAPVMNSHIQFDKRLVKGKIETFEDINISMPMILPNGKMMTVNLRNFENKSLADMKNEITKMQKKAENTNLDEALFEVSFYDTMKEVKKGKIKKAIFRLVGSKFGKHRVKTLHGKAKKEYEKIPTQDRLTAKDLEQGTVTVSNIGSLYKGQKGEMALLEIVPPQVCAFGVGAVTEKPCVITKHNGKKEIGIKKVLPICIAFDHRALDFGDIIPFLQRIDAIAETPTLLKEFSESEEKIVTVA